MLITDELSPDRNFWQASAAVQEISTAVKTQVNKEHVSRHFWRCIYIRLPCWRRRTYAISQSQRNHAWLGPPTVRAIIQNGGMTSECLSSEQQYTRKRKIQEMLPLSREERLLLAIETVIKRRPVTSLRKADRPANSKIMKWNPSKVSIQTFHHSHFSCHRSLKSNSPSLTRQRMSISIVLQLPSLR